MFHTGWLIPHSAKSVIHKISLPYSFVHAIPSHLGLGGRSEVGEKSKNSTYIFARNDLTKYVHFFSIVCVCVCTNN